MAILNLFTVRAGNKPKSPSRPSMAQDVMKQRPTEIQYLTGFISEGERETGIATHYSDTVREIMKDVESGEFEVGLENIIKLSKTIGGNSESFRKNCSRNGVR